MIIASIGISGSGKTTYLKENHPKDLYVSSDDIRGVFGDINSQERNRDVFVVYEYLIRYFSQTTKRNNLPHNIICDSTNYSRKNRKLIISLAKELGEEIKWIYFKTPIDECKKRNGARDRVVPEFVIDRQSDGLVLPDEEEMDGVKYSIEIIDV